MGFPDYKPDFLSTSELARNLRVDSKLLFAYLSSNGYLTKENNQWKLTQLGQQVGATYGSVGGPWKFPVWPHSLLSTNVFENLISDESQMSDGTYKPEEEERLEGIHKESSHNKDVSAKSPERRKNFSKCNRNQFFTNYRVEKEQGLCQNCKLKLSAQNAVIHHTTYNHECVYRHPIASTRTRIRRGRICRIKCIVPDCETCYHDHNENFLLCQALTELLCNRCHRAHHLSKPNSLASKMNKKTLLSKIALERK